MSYSASEIQAMQKLKFPRMVGKGILCCWIDQMAVCEEQASRMLANTLKKYLLCGVIEEAGYRDRLKAWQPEKMAELELYEAAQSRFDEINKMDAATIIQLKSDEQQYLEHLRELPDNATLDDVRLVDEGLAWKIPASGPREFIRLVNRYSPAALTSTTCYGTTLVAYVAELARQRREAKLTKLNEVVEDLPNQS